MQARWGPPEPSEHLEEWLLHVEIGLADGDPAAVGEALAFLEQDPFFYRSGYARSRIAMRLSTVPLPDAERVRARAVVLGSVDGVVHCGRPGIGRLGRSVADNELRRSLRLRLHSADAAVAHRALRMLLDVRRPGLSPLDRRRAQELVLDTARRQTYLTPSVERLARWLWTAEWAGELRHVGRRHGPDRAAARHLLQRYERRPGP